MSKDLHLFEICGIIIKASNRFSEEWVAKPTLSCLGKGVDMKKNAVETAVIAIADKLAEQMNLFVVDVECKKEGSDRVLRIFIDKPDGVGIDDCEEFSRAVEPLIDEEDPIKEAYTLEVSSPGADRKLVWEREFLYYIGREVDVKLYKALDGKKEFTGILADYDGDEVTVSTDGTEVKVKVSEAVYIRLHFEF